MRAGSQDNTSFIKTIINVIANNFWLKILSIVFAIVIFFIVRTDKDLSFDKVATVKLKTSSSSMIILGSKERSLDVTIRQQNSIFSISPSDNELLGEIDIVNQAPGRIRVKISRDNFPNLPKHYSMIIEKPYIDVEIDKLQEKTLPIQAVLKGNPKSGFIVDQVKVIPAFIKVSGARQQLARTQNIFTMPIIIEGIDKNLITKSNIELEEASDFHSNEKSVLVSVTLTSKIFYRTFLEIPIKIKNKKLNSHLQLHPKTINVELSSQKDILSQIKSSDIDAYIDTSNLNPGWQDKSITIKLPNNVSIVKMLPDTISVHLNP